MNATPVPIFKDIFVTYEGAKLARVFVPGKPFQQSVIFARLVQYLLIKLLYLTIGVLNADQFIYFLFVCAQKHIFLH